MLIEEKWNLHWVIGGDFIVVGFQEERKLETEAHMIGKCLMP